MPSSLFLFGPLMLLFQAALLLALAWTLARLWRWQAWWQRTLVMALAWLGCSVGGFVLFAFNGADVFLLPAALAMTAIPAALLAMLAWWLGERLVKKID